MGSRELAGVARGPDDYQQVYSRVLAQADRPVILHWLGEAFDPHLADYWGARDPREAAQSLLAIIRENAALIASGSHALLGIFDVIAPAAATALRALDEGDTRRYQEILAPTVPLARKIFEAPTYNYKTGLAFLAWLAGHQEAFVMVRGAQSARSLPHLAAVFRLADHAGLLADPELAARRMSALLALHGCVQ